MNKSIQKNIIFNSSKEFRSGKGEYEGIVIHLTEMRGFLSNDFVSGQKKLPEYNHFIVDNKNIIQLADLDYAGDQDNYLLHIILCEDYNEVYFRDVYVNTLWLLTEKLKKKGLNNENMMLDISVEKYLLFFGITKDRFTKEVEEVLNSKT